MSRILVVTNPSHDDITSYFGAWMEKAEELASSRSDTAVIGLAGRDASKIKLAEIIEQHKPQLVLLNGHGNGSAIAGFNDEILIKCDDNEHLLRGTISHMLACDTGTSLGPKTIEVGGLAYVGYTQPFKLAFNRDAKNNDERRNDAAAKLILDPAFEAVIALIEGATVGEAFVRSQAKHIEILRHLATVPTTDNITKIGGIIYHNFRYQLRLGDSNAHF